MKCVETVAFRFIPGKEFSVLDQSLLPEQKKRIPIHTPDDMASAIQNLKVRGANLIGITAGFSLAHYALSGATAQDVERSGERLSGARPTAIHLSSAVRRVLCRTSVEGKLEEAWRIYEEDGSACENLIRLSRPLIEKKDGILTYCNTGSLAAGGEGTALGIIKQAHRDGKNVRVYCCETRPALQGSRLTVWELTEADVPCVLICDSMAGDLMARGKIQKVIVGADRISRNGDTANKVGTLTLALSARHFKIPFYVSAPSSCFDKNLKTGGDIPIEKRDPEEISRFWKGKVSIYNPAFDVTPSSLITGIITEKEIINPRP